MTFWDEARVAACPHGPWLEDGPDAFGDRTCAKCETKVRVTLTEATWKTRFNKLASDAGLRPVFPEID